MIDIKGDMTITMPTTTFSQQLFFSPETGTWKALKPDVSGETDDAKKQQMLSAAASAREELRAVLLSSLQMQHVVALAGSGKSLRLDQRPVDVDALGPLRELKPRHRE